MFLNKVSKIKQNYLPGFKYNSNNKIRQLPMKESISRWGLILRKRVLGKPPKVLESLLPIKAKVKKKTIFWRDDKLLLSFNVFLTKDFTLFIKKQILFSSYKHNS